MERANWKKRKERSVVSIVTISGQRKCARASHRGFLDRGVRYTDNPTAHRQWISGCDEARKPKRSPMTTEGDAVRDKTKSLETYLRTMTR